MENKVIPGVLGVFVVICLVGGMLVPIIDGMGEGEPTVNPDAGWIRMNYDTSASTYTITIAPGEVGITVTNGTDTQAGADDTIFYADSNVAVWMQDGEINVLGQNTDGPQFFQPLDPVTITRTADSVAIDDGSTTLTFGTPAWAYVPISSGTFGFFASGLAASTGGNPVAAVGGGFAGVYAYNNIIRYDLPLQLQTDMEDGKIIGAYWEKPAEADSLSITPLDPGSITIQPLDPSVVDPEPDASIMSVPTPTYTDGDWGYKTQNIYDYDLGHNVTKAIIQAYLGSDTDIVVPSTIGGYPVQRFGDSTSSSSTNAEVFNNSDMSDFTLTFSEGIKEIGAGALYNITKLKSVTFADSITTIGKNAFSGSGITELKLPSNIKTIESNAFYYTSVSGEVVIPASCTTISQYAFTNSQIDTLVILSSAVTISTNIVSGTPISNLVISSDSLNASAFANAASLSEVLDMTENGSMAPGSYGIPATATVQDSIGDSIGYIGSAVSPGQSGLPSSVTGLMFAIPIVIFAACIAVGAAVYLKRE